MPVSSTDQAHIRAEKAVAAYIRGTRDANADDATYTAALDLDCIRTGALLGIPVYEGRQTTPMSAPAIIVEAARGTLIADGTDWYEVPVLIRLVTHYREDGASTAKPEVVHNARAKAIDDLIAEEADVKAALNIPANPLDDARDVDEFHVMGYYLDDCGGEIKDGHIVERFEMVLFCCPWDAA